MPKKPLLCPTCKQPVTTTNPEFPFCSDRCRIIDLGKWASGEYRIASPVFDEELLEELDRAQQELEHPGEAPPRSDWKN